MKKLITFFTVIIISTTAFAQIPNGGFDTWTNTSGYNMPTGWDNLNPMTSPMSVYTCTKGTPGVVGSGYLELNTQNVSGMGVMPGVAVSGKMDMMSFTALSGFPYAMRPTQLTGSWQYMASGSDMGFISVLLTKWNIAMSKRDTVSYTIQNLSGMMMSWAPFTINLTYMSTSVPDSAIIILSASNLVFPVAGSMLNVDNLALAGVPSSVAVIAGNSSLLFISPNPATGSAALAYHSISGKDVEVLLTDMAGRNLIKMSSNTIMGDNNISLNVSNLAKGIYLLKVIDGDNIQVQKLVKE